MKQGSMMGLIISRVVNRSRARTDASYSYRDDLVNDLDFHFDEMPVLSSAENDMAKIGASYDVVMLQKGIFSQSDHAVWPDFLIDCVAARFCWVTRTVRVAPAFCGGEFDLGIRTQALREHTKVYANKIVIGYQVAPRSGAQPEVDTVDLPRTKSADSPDEKCPDKAHRIGCAAGRS